MVIYQTGLNCTHLLFHELLWVRSQTLHVLAIQHKPENDPYQTDSTKCVKHVRPAHIWTDLSRKTQIEVYIISHTIIACSVVYNNLHLVPVAMMETSWGQKIQTTYNIIGRQHNDNVKRHWEFCRHNMVQSFKNTTSKV